ncbi:MAG: peptide ABC transporter permease, partial [Pseudomonadota bacterium]
MLGTRASANALAQAEPIRGRSLWADARARFFRNKAGTVSLAVLAGVGLFALFGPAISPWSNEEIDWAVLGQVESQGRPSLETGHWFGTDPLGRDLFARTVQGTQVSLMVGIVGALIAVIVGTLYGAISGYFGGRTDDVMMRVVDVLMAIPYM